MHVHSGGNSEVWKTVNIERLSGSWDSDGWRFWTTAEKNEKRFAWHKIIIVRAKLQSRRPQPGERFDPIVSWN